MSPVIRQLPDHVVEQVAAGEVIERPSSVIKELLENAADAGAQNIRVEVRHGCSTLIVEDDGEGMGAEQLPLALRTHATSKLRDIEDLTDIGSYGFRGEALASIRSISQLRLVSRERGEGKLGSAYSIDGKGAETFEVAPIDASVALLPRGGTRVEVADLFYNVPARAGFLRQSGTEWRHIQRVVALFSLGVPQIAIELLQDGHGVWQLPACNTDEEMRARAEKTLGGELELTQVQGQATDMRLRGWVGSASSTSRGRSAQVLLVNDRAVSDRRVSSAVRAGFEGLLHGNQMPLYVLWLDLPGKDVDVNVHPAKTEVRFRYDRAVYGFVRSAVRRAVTEQRPARATTLLRDAPASGHAGAGGEKAAPLQGLRSATRTPASAVQYHPFAPESAPDPATLQPSSQDDAPAAQPQTSAAENRTQPTLDPATGFAPGRLLGYLHKTFLLLEAKDGLVVVDVHAVHERILYARMRELWDKGRIKPQRLVLPSTYSLSPAEADACELVEEELQRVGYEWRRLDESRIEVTSLPQKLDAADCEKAFRAALQAVATGGGLEQAKAAMSQVIQDALGDLACKSAIKSGDSLTTQEQEQLLLDMAETEAGDYCNHGRPSWNFVPLAEFDRMCYRGR